MTEKEQVTAFISYAQEDQAYADVFIKEFEKHSNFSEQGGLKWITGTAKDIPQAAGCDFAILLVSPAFLNSQYLEKPEINNFLKKAAEERFLFFPIMLEACDYSSREELAKRPFFVPKGVDYGKPWIKHLSYSDLVKFGPAGTGVLPDPTRKRYMTALVKAFNNALQQHKPKPKRKGEKEKEKNKYFKLIKSTKDLVPEDIMGPGKRAAGNKDFYWRRKPDDILDTHLKNGRSALILGNSLAGKTRALYEGLKKLKNTTILVPRDRFTIEDDFALPETATGKIVAVLDDIDEILSHNSVEHLDNLLLRLMEQGVTIAATCRRGNEYRAFDGMVAPRVREYFERIFINRMTENQVSGFKAFFYKKTGGKGTLDEKAFDGNIGSYFMNFTIMRERYRDLEKLIMDYPMNIPEKLPREILKALKYFYYTENTEGKSLFCADKIKDFCERALLGKRPRSKRTEKTKKTEENNWQQKLDLFASPVNKEEYTKEEWDAALTVLSETDYDLNFIQPEPPYIHVEEAYLERVVARGMQLDRIVGILNTFYRGEDLQRHGFLTSVFGFNKLISLARSSDEAYRIFSKLKTLGIHPTVVTFTSLINKADSFKNALSFLDKMKEYKIRPDQIAFHSLFLKAGFKDALILLEKMKEHNVAPNEHIFTALINKADSFKDAHTFLDKMNDYNIQPDQIIFTSLINKADTFKNALVFFEKMADHDIKPDAITFNSMIHKAESFTDALAFLDKMKSCEIRPNEITVTLLINKTGSFKEVLTMLDKMQEHKTKLNISAFTALLDKSESFKDTMEILTRMKTMNIQANKVFINQLTQKVRRNPGEAITHLFESFEPKEIFSDYLFNRIISQACRTDASHLEKVIPHLEIIGQQRDTIIIFYSRLMEYNDKADTALKLLENVTNKTFDYYNIKANCLKNTDMKSSLEHYRLAVENTGDKKQKAIGLNNMAQLIFDHGQTNLYAEAIDYCKQALALEPFRFFPYPGHLLLLFTIHNSPLKDLKKNVGDILKTYKIPRQTLNEIADKIEDKEKRKRLISK